MHYSLEIFVGIIFALSIISLTLILERVWSIVYRMKNLDRSAQEQLLEYVQQKKYDDAASFCRLQNHTAFQVALAVIMEIYGSNAKKKKIKDLRDIAEEVTLEQIRFLEKYIPSLGTISTVSPLLGLLGTVTGMIKSFSAFEQGASRSQELFGGIDEALITTAFGLVVAIPSLVMYNFFVRRVSVLVSETNLLVDIMLKIVEKPKK